MSSTHESLEQKTDLEEKYHQLQTKHYQLEDEYFAVQHQLRRIRQCYRLFFLLLMAGIFGLLVEIAGTRRKR